MKRTSTFAVIIGLLIGCPFADAQVGGALQSARVVLDNAKVRVIEYRSEPNGGICGVGRHSHPAHVTIVLEAARDRLTNVSGKTEESDLKVGDVYWSDG